MSNDPTTTATEAPADLPVAAPTTTELEHVTEDLLVEDVSIDGMCGVY